MAMDDIELFLLDVNMPNLDGIGLTRKIRISMHYKFTPIIALTTESGEFVKKDGKSAGCTGWILKPLDPDTIIATLEDLLEED
jgi:two-component system chemotaxis response regulator CheY